MAIDSVARLGALRKLLSQGQLTTQEELKGELSRLRFEVTQSTISRDLRKVGAVKAVDPQGRTVYRLPEEALTSVTSGSLRELISEIQTNQSMIVIHTQPGSASLVARLLDQKRPAGILGTIAGDDTIFVAPSTGKTVKITIQAIEDCLSVGA